MRCVRDKGRPRETSPSPVLSRRRVSSQVSLSVHAGGAITSTRGTVCAPIDAIAIEGLLLVQECRQRSDPPHGVKVKDRTKERNKAGSGAEDISNGMERLKCFSTGPPNQWPLDEIIKFMLKKSEPMLSSWRKLAQTRSLFPIPHVQWISLHSPHARP